MSVTAEHEQASDGGAADRPSVFISYRTADSRTVAQQLSKRLRKDLGSAGVFRDQDDLVAGQPWKRSLERAIDASTSVVFLVGDDWVGGSEDGRRIDQPDDPVRAEVVHTLASPSRPTPIPVITGSGRPSELPADVRPLFDGPTAADGSHDEQPHMIRGSGVSLASGLSGSYQQLLVAIWVGMQQRQPGSVLIVGDETAMVDLDAFVDQLRHRKLIDKKQMTRFASGAVIVTPYRAFKGNKKWPDAIVLANDDYSPTVGERAEALRDHRGVRVAAVALGGLAAAATIGPVAIQSTGQFVSSLPSAPNALVSAIGSTWGGMAIGAKVAVGVATVAAAATTGVAIAPDSTNSIGFDDRSTLSIAPPTDDRQYPFGQPPDLSVSLGDPQPTDDTGKVPASLGGTRLAYPVTLSFDGADYELDAISLPTDLGDVLSSQSDGTYDVDAIVLGEAPLDVAGLGVSEFCFRREDPSIVDGGWRFTSSAPSLIVKFAAVVDSGRVVDTFITATISGDSELEWITPPDEGRNVSRCLPRQTTNLFWRGP